MIPRVACCLLGITAIMFAAQQSDSKASEPTVRVECVGKLRHGLVAVGGETTGTTITFEGTTWELKLANADSRQQAETLNKKPVIVSGTLRHVRGVEVPSRWIVEVDKLAAGDSGIGADVKRDGAKIALMGMLKRSPAQTDTTADSTGLTMTVDGITWRLDFGDNRDLESKSKGLDHKPVSIKGIFVRGDSAKQGGPLTLKVNSLAPATTR